MQKIIFILHYFSGFLPRMASRDAEDRTEREHFDSRSDEIRNLPNYDEIYHQLSSLYF